MDRREFIAALALLALPGTLLEGCARIGVSESGDETILLPMAGKLGIYRRQRDQFRVVNVPNAMPHSVILNPARPRHVLVLDQLDVHATLVDIVDGKVLAVGTPEKNYGFSGHGCISADGERLYLCENFRSNLNSPTQNKPQSRITIRNASTLKVLKEIPGQGTWAHNVMFMKKETILVVGYQGVDGKDGEPKEGGEIAFLSAATGEVVERFHPADTHWSLNHFDLTADEHLVVAAQTSYREKLVGTQPASVKDLVAPILLGGMGQARWTSEMPKSLRDHILRNHTVCVDRQRNRAVVAHQFGGCISIWDIAHQSLVGTLEISTPQGISNSLDGTHYIVVNKAKDIIYVDAQSLRVTSQLGGEHFGSASLDGPQHIGMLAYPS